MKKPYAKIMVFNPFEAIYPGRRIIPQEAIGLAKRIRNAGIPVNIGSEGKNQVHFIARKGLEEAFQDPIIVFFLGVTKDIAIGLVSAWLYDFLKSKKASKINPSKCTVIIGLSEDGRQAYYTHEGKAISEKRFNAIKGMMKKRQEDFAESLKANNPTPDLPIPIYLEHSSKIVGWGKLIKDDAERGLRFSPAKIFDPEAKRRVEKGELKGFSITMLVKKAICSKCGRDFRDCEHGDESEKDPPTVRLTEVDYCEASIVKTPVNQGCVIEKAKK